MYPKGFSKRWYVTREFENVSDEEIATMTEGYCRDMASNGINVESIFSFLDTQIGENKRVITLLRLDQHVIDRTVFFYFATDKAIVASLTFEGFKNRRRGLLRSKKPCLYRNVKSELELIPITIPDEE